MIYFDNGATSFPKPESVYKRIDWAMRNYGANPGRSGHKMALEGSRVIYDTREIVANLFNIDNPMDVAFTLNATDSLNIGIRGILKKGDHVITSSMEHNSVLRPLKELEIEKIINLTIVKCNKEGEIKISDLERSIKGNTKLIVTTHASNVTGTLFPIEEIGKLCKERDIIYMVDSAQTAGIYDVDVKKMNIDILIFTGHKSLLGPQGVGGIYVKEGIDISPFRTGGTGSNSESLIQPSMMPDKLESGTPNTIGIAGLGAGIEYINKVGIKAIREKEEINTKYFLEKLFEINGVKVYGPEIEKKRAPVISLNLKEEDSSEIAYILDEVFDIGIRSGLHCAPLAHKTIGTFDQGTIRFSLGLYTEKEHIDLALVSLKEIMKNI